MAILQMSTETRSLLATGYVEEVLACRTKDALKALNAAGANKDFYHTAIGLRAVYSVMESSPQCRSVTESVSQKHLQKIKLSHEFVAEKVKLEDSDVYKELTKISATYQLDLNAYQAEAFFEPLYKKAMSGNVVALKVLGQCYVRVPSDYKSAIFCFEQAALLDDTPLCENFTFYFIAPASDNMRARALELEAFLLKSAHEGDLNARLYLGCLYLSFALGNGHKALKALNNYVLGLIIFKVPLDHNILQNLRFIEERLPYLSRNENSPNIEANIQHYLLPTAPEEIVDVVG